MTRSWRFLGIVLSLSLFGCSSRLTDSEIDRGCDLADRCRGTISTTCTAALTHARAVADANGCASLFAETTRCYLEHNECSGSARCGALNNRLLACSNGLEPMETVPPYAFCTADQSCLGGTDCFTVTAAGEGMCTRACNSTLDCPRDAFGDSARCLSFDSGRSSYCFQACNPSAGFRQCEGVYECFDSDSSGLSFPPICLPR
jgi:hypothetical protein